MSDAIKRLEAYPAEDVEMDLAGTAVPDDQFHEKPQLEEPEVSEEVPNAARLAIMRVHKNVGHPSKEVLCRALRIGGANNIAIRVASERLLGEQTSAKSLFTASEAPWQNGPVERNGAT